jgi:hypothetical protein
VHVVRDLTYRLVGEYLWMRIRLRDRRRIMRPTAVVISSFVLPSDVLDKVGGTC